MLTGIRNLPIWVRVTAFLLIVLTGTIGGMTLWSIREQERFALRQAHDFSASAAELTMTGLRTIMLSGDMAQEKVFLDEVRRSPGIETLEVVPAEAMGLARGNAAPGGSRLDAVDRQVLAEGRSYAGQETVNGSAVKEALKAETA